MTACLFRCACMHLPLRSDPACPCPPCCPCAQYKGGEANPRVSVADGCMHGVAAGGACRLGARSWAHLTPPSSRACHSGVTLKTRKRNIVIPVDPASFANAVIAICQEAAEAAGATTLEEKLNAGCKALEADNSLEFSRYNDTLFEVFFVGGMIAAGGKLAEETASPLEENVGGRQGVGDRATLLGSPYA
jgi:hypothetical protein